MPVILSQEDAAKTFGGDKSDGKPQGQEGGAGGSGSGSGSTGEGGEKIKASAQDLMQKGPVQVDDLPPKASKDELKARMEELNK